MSLERMAAELSALNRSITDLAVQAEGVRAQNAAEHAAIKEDLGEVKEHKKEQNGRISKIEAWRWKLTGIFLVVMVLYGLWLRGLISVAAP